MLLKNFKIKIIGIFLTVVAIITFLLTPIFPTQASPFLLDKIKGNLQKVNQEAFLPEGGVGNFPVLIGVIIQAALLFVSIIFLVITIYGGFIWMTAGGNPQRVEKATSMIRNGVIGLLIIFVSYAITLFVFNVLLKSASVL